MPPRLNDGEIHVWKAFLDESSLADDTVLSADETDRASRYRFARDRRRFVAGRSLLRTILGSYLGRRASELVFDYGPHGKPRLVLPPGEAPLHFNVTHADALALYAVSRGGEVGVDVEHIRAIPEWDSIASDCFSAAECARLRRLSPDRRQREFFHVWTRQEAILKASGQGLTGDRLGWSSARGAGYFLHTMTPAPGYLATLVGRHVVCRMVFLTWPAATASTFLPTVETQEILL